MRERKKENISLSNWEVQEIASGRRHGWIQGLRQCCQRFSFFTKTSPLGRHQAHILPVSHLQSRGSLPNYLQRESSGEDSAWIELDMHPLLNQYWG